MEMENNAGLTPEERQRVIELIADAEMNREKQEFISFAGNAEMSYSDSFESYEGFGGNVADKLPVFDVDLLPCRVRGFSKALCESLQVSPGMVAPAVVTITALGIQKKFVVRPLPGWVEPSNLYIAIVFLL